VAETTSSPSPSRPRPSSRAESASAPSEGPAKARIIAIANQKGGVGKSTTAVSLGAALAEDGYQVLVLDLDPQGNASTGMGLRHETRDVTVYDVLANDAGIEQAIVKTPVEGLHAVPSTIDLAGAEIELVSQFSREMRLRKALDPIREGPYDFILMDCPPSLGLLTVNALAAAEELIVPIQCEYYALEGLGQLLRNVKLVQQNVNPGLQLTGIVLTMFDPRTKLSEQVVAEVRRYFGDRVYQTVIPRTVRLSEAPGFGQPITVYDPKSRGAERYRSLAKEVAAEFDVPKAYADYLILKILRASNGEAVAVSDDEMRTGAAEMGAAEGLFAAPEGGAAWRFASFVILWREFAFPLQGSCFTETERRDRAPFGCCRRLGGPEIAKHANATILDIDATSDSCRRDGDIRLLRLGCPGARGFSSLQQFRQPGECFSCLYRWRDMGQRGLVEFKTKRLRDIGAGGAGGRVLLCLCDGRAWRRMEGQGLHVHPRP
jgi:chromosome partitioning protein